ncbi:MAG: hypothetical protein RIM84_00950 [Alphaproteobacteria bacterium]
MRLGIDLDNTIVSYDALFADLAVRRGLLRKTPIGGKRAVCDAVRRGAGEAAWQALQAEVYGPAMADAKPFDGVIEFVRDARGQGIEVRIISHKTRRAAAAPDGCDLHEAALAWLDANGFFRDDGLRPEDVRFLPTRADKLDAIAAAGCTHFIDDLVEVLADPAFPTDVARYLFAPTGACTDKPYKVCQSWRELSHELLAA